MSRSALGPTQPPLQRVPGGKAVGAWTWSFTSILYRHLERIDYQLHSVYTPSRRGAWAQENFYNQCLLSCLRTTSNILTIRNWIMLLYVTKACNFSQVCYLLLRLGVRAAQSDIFRHLKGSRVWQYCLKCFWYHYLLIIRQRTFHYIESSSSRTSLWEITL